MKRLWKGLLISAAVCTVLAWAMTLQNAKAQTSTSTTKYSAWNVGQVMGEGVIRWRLATLCADTDTSMIAASLVNLWNDDNTQAPSRVFVAIHVDSAAGGGAGSRLHLRAYRHFITGETAGAGIAQLFARGNAAGIDTLNLLVGTGTKVTTHGFFSTHSAVANPVAETHVSPYMSLKIDKEGVKRFTAGYVDVYWKAIR